MTDINSDDLDQAIEERGATIHRDGMKSGDVVVVTGAARGFGRAISRRLARDSAKLAVWDMLEDEGEETASLCRQLGADATFFHCDMGDPDSIRDAAKGVLNRLGSVYALVNNAGIHPRARSIEVPLEMWNRTLAVNLTGSFLACQAFGRQMMDNQRGVIINFASGRAIQGAVGGIHYAATKAGLIAMTKTLATEWAEFGIRVNAIIPGVSETRQPLEAPGVTLESLRERGSNVPLGRVGHPDDIAGMVAILLSPDAAFVTGQSVAINGGAIMLP
ncbi:SDR family oxidoreductase [Alphaproteobacteria bacterium]|nr:SDR family oxidoreductase [Alphaproteobacteria bacterium]